MNADDIRTTCDTKRVKNVAAKWGLDPSIQSADDVLKALEQLADQRHRAQMEDVKHIVMAALARYEQ